jgi:hypothetical protein
MPKNDFRKNREARNPLPEGDAQPFVTQEVVTLTDPYHPTPAPPSVPIAPPVEASQPVPVQPTPMPPTQQVQPSPRSESPNVDFYSHLDKRFVRPLEVIIEDGVAISKTHAINKAMESYFWKLQQKQQLPEPAESSPDWRSRSRRRLPNKRVNDRFVQFTTQIRREYDEQFRNLISQDQDRSKREIFNDIVLQYLLEHPIILERGGIDTEDLID